MIAVFEVMAAKVNQRAGGRCTKGSASSLSLLSINSYLFVVDYVMFALESPTGPARNKPSYSGQIVR